MMGSNCVIRVFINPPDIDFQFEYFEDDEEFYEIEDSVDLRNETFEMDLMDYVSEKSGPLLDVM